MEDDKIDDLIFALGDQNETRETIDALVAALEDARDHIIGSTGAREGSDSADVVRRIDAALALARGGK
ncbi:hypothetical protein [Mesorhizobium sp. NZP2298]|uniref:hypothetical protein n=1 Tax=Mesorhizobium sp. NZP2298 TaxID=2483403 RepID=UPI0015556E80|nr:hypothetical protein [Mesorhizobium sp. NZP2298]